MKGDNFGFYQFKINKIKSIKIYISYYNIKHRIPVNHLIDFCKFVTKKQIEFNIDACQLEKLIKNNNLVLMDNLLNLISANIMTSLEYTYDLPNINAINVLLDHATYQDIYQVRSKV